MRVYGYKKKELSPKGLCEMREVTFVASVATLLELAEFFRQAADELERNRARFDHLHAESTFQSWNDKWPQVIVSK